MFREAKSLVLALTLCHILSNVVEAELRVGFYSKTCPKAESIVTSVVKEAALINPRVPALLLRLHFHDCFVHGCDGSILIENDRDAEKNAPGHQGLGGFDEIDRAKAKLEAVCPGVVSCSDIVALAARDAIALSRGPFYQVETGRRDGRISNMSLAGDMPEVDDSIELLKSKFGKKGLSHKHLVLLSGAHTIGTTACFFMQTRLYHFKGKDWGPDPEINPELLPRLMNDCPKDGDQNARIAMDWASNDWVFDDSILRNIKDGFAVLASDARLYDDNTTRAAIDSYAGSSASAGSFTFGLDFASSMVKMGQIGAKTGSEGEIRINCRRFN